MLRSGLSLAQLGKRPQIAGRANSPGIYSGSPKDLIAKLFLLFSTLVAVPFLRIPLIGLSLSAPILFLIALEVLAVRRRVWAKGQKVFFGLAVLIWVGIILSSAVNGFTTVLHAFQLGDLLAVAQYGYWLLAFVVTIYCVLEFGLFERVALVFGICVIILGLLRWFEGLFFGEMGAYSETIFYTPNGYGILFSTFTPYLYWLAMSERRTSRIWLTFCIICTGGAIAINGSRGSWVAIAIAFIVFILMLQFTQGFRLSRILTIVAILVGFAGLSYLGSDQITATVEQRYSTFDNLAYDKPYLIRQLMVQKGLRLFEENPFMGVGPNRFKVSSVPLDRNEGLKYAQQQHFDTKSAHNSYIAFLAETGLCGSFPFTVLILILLVSGGKAALRLGRKGNSWAIGIYVSFLSMSIHLWVISALTTTATWLVYGLVAAMIIYEKASYRPFIHPR